MAQWILNSELLILGKKEIEISSSEIILPSHHSIGGSGGARDVHPPLSPIYFIFMQFSGKIWLSNRLVHPLGAWRPMGNPGDPTLHNHGDPEFPKDGV